MPAITALLATGPAPGKVTISDAQRLAHAIAAGLDLDGTPIPAEMLSLYNEVMDRFPALAGASRRI